MLAGVIPFSGEGYFKVDIDKFKLYASVFFKKGDKVMVARVTYFTKLLCELT